jgi:hypothetical protein
LGRTLVQFGERLTKTTEERKPALTGETSVGKTNEAGDQNNEFKTGFPGESRDGEVQGSIRRTPIPMLIAQSNENRIRQLEAQRRRMIMENARNKYRQNAYLQTRGLISGKRLPTETRFMSRDLSFSNQNQVLPPGLQTSNQNRVPLFARRTSRRRVSTAGSSLSEQQGIRLAQSTDRQSARDRLDRQSARDRLKQVSVSRSEGANSYLKRLLYNILRRIERKN